MKKIYLGLLALLTLVSCEKTKFIDLEYSKWERFDNNAHYILDMGVPEFSKYDQEQMEEWYGLAAGGKEIQGDHITFEDFIVRLNFSALKGLAIIKIESADHQFIKGRGNVLILHYRDNLSYDMFHPSWSEERTMELDYFKE